MPSRLPVLLIHGYSDQGKSFEAWANLLGQQGYQPTTIHIGDYQTLTNEVTIKDIAEGLDRALRDEAGLKEDEPFDALVHSTGMLVIRSWLTAYGNRKNRLKHLVGLAPATFGSPLAHKGRSWLGTIFKSNKALGPDFMEAGDKVLDGLELASAFVWNLAHQDLVGTETFYGPSKRTPYPFIFCGTSDYGGVRKLINEPGTDGTVRWAGCSLNTRKIVLDFSGSSANAKNANGIVTPPWPNMDDMPLTLVPDKNHETILTEPDSTLVKLVATALQVDSEADYAAWRRQAAKVHARAADKVKHWQQFIVRALNERDDPVTDYNLQLYSRDQTSILRKFALNVHTYSGDKSLRCFHVNLSDLDLNGLSNLCFQLTASTGSTWVGYQSPTPNNGGESGPDQEDGFFQVEMDLSPLLRKNSDVKLFYPFTTTLVEVRLNREPLPLKGKNLLFSLRELSPAEK